MLDNLFELVKSHAGNAIINNPAIPNEHNDAAVEVASSSIFDTLKNAATGGNIGDIMSMFSGGSNNAASSPIAGLIQNNMVQSLIQKFGLEQGAASNVASGLIPNVLQNLVHKTNDPNDSSFDIQGILSKVTGGAGGFNIGNIVSNLTGGNNNQENSGGGMLDSIKGLFGG
jgi:uncharacterized protein YidB (DUF937 family)